VKDDALILRQRAASTALEPRTRRSVPTGYYGAQSFDGTRCRARTCSHTGGITGRDVLVAPR
jgi:hypothetical protein